VLRDVSSRRHQKDCVRAQMQLHSGGAGTNPGAVKFWLDDMAQPFVRVGRVYGTSPGTHDFLRTFFGPRVVVVYRGDVAFSPVWQVLLELQPAFGCDLNKPMHFELSILFVGFH
jgi:hypothetical protein